MTFASRLVLASLGSLVPFAAALPAQGAPKPPPEVRRLDPLIGNWAGSGTMTEPSATTKWTANGTYRSVLGGFWIQEDFVTTFEGNADPLVFRAYLGWDAERKTFVYVSVNNGGEAQVHDFTLQPDGTMVQLMLQHLQGAPYAERSLSKVTADTMTLSIDVLTGDGPSRKIIDGKFERQDAEGPSALDAKGTWMGAQPHEAMQKLARAVGSYEMKGDVAMKPGQPAMKFTGVDTWRSIFGGTVLHVHTDGAFAGMPVKYECDAFWSWNAKKECLVLIAVNNMGAAGAMEGRFTADGKAVVTTRSMTMEGQPSVARTVIGLDDQGQPKSCLSHLMVGTSAPFEHLNATCTKK
jgi:hypothetical protein